jgi:hypothetical protein|tara:strand:- start:5143 stop:5346 length:204 start_codon:yes stop_codon:yes gene_type:complete
MFEVKEAEDLEILKALARVAPVKPYVKDFKFRHFVSKRTNLPLCGIEHFCMGTDIRAEVTCEKCRDP